MRKTAFRPIGIKLPGAAGAAFGVGLKALDVLDVKRRAEVATQRMKKMQTPAISGAIPVQNVAAQAMKVAACSVKKDGSGYTVRSKAGVMKVAGDSDLGKQISAFFAEYSADAVVFGDKGAVVLKTAMDLSTVSRVVSGAAATALGGAIFIGGGQAVGAAAKGVGSIFERSRREKLFKEVIRLDPSLKSNPRSREYFDLIMTYAPSLGDHPTAVGDFLRRQMQYPVSGIEFLNSLAMFEKTVGQSRMYSGTAAMGHGFSEYGAGALSKGIGEALKPPAPAGRH